VVDLLQHARQNVPGVRKWGTATDDFKDARILRALSADRDAFAAAVRAGKLYRLLWVKFKIIDGCNIRCVMCNHWRRHDYQRNALPTRRMMALADELAELGCRHVNWSGGEPTLRKDLPEIIRRLRERKIGSSLITNGTLLGGDVLDRYLDAGLETVIFSLESGDPAAHDEEVGDEGAWEKLVTAATRFGADKARAPRMQFNTVLTSINTGPGLLKMVPIAARAGVAQIELIPTTISHLTAEERRTLPPSPEQVARFRNEWLPAMFEAGERLGVKIVPRGEPEADQQEEPDLVAIGRPRSEPRHILGYYQDTGRNCYLPFYHTTIDHNGNVTACCKMRSGVGVVGNLADTPLVDVLHGDLAKRLRQLLTSPDKPSECAECTMQIAENQAIDQLLGLGGSEEPAAAVAC
jgi:radical SAM protein with 4Fe4S-binding SPASM domain